ncbi:g2842 [Coccomyxa viridis]|uniref:G2842 protein n=1 Tax=Coccomyxa viridis TaxID=1274662 RepID=A0ABP1FPD6_9CHLO
MQLVLALGMMVNSPITAQLPASLLWPLVPLMANRVLEALCFLLGYITPLFSVVQLPLSVMALGVYIKASSCTPWSKSHATAPPQPFCSAPIVLAATIVLIEVMIFLMVLYITQTFRHERFLQFAQQLAAVDVEQAR